MRAVAVLLALASPLLAGCLDGDDDRPVLRAFKATYETEDGNVFEVSLSGPQTLLGPDGESRPAYRIMTHAVGFEGGESYQDVDATFRVVRLQGCYSWSEGRCDHARIDFVPWSDHPGWGIGLPLRLPTDRQDGLVRVADPWAEPEDLADQFYEYKPGELWPQRHVRESKDFGVRIDLFHLVSVEVGDALAGASEWPSMPAAGAAAATTDLFPGSEQAMFDRSLSVAKAMQVLGEDEQAAPVLAGGCFVATWVSAHRFSSRPLLPPIVAPELVDSLTLGVVSSAGIQSNWEVRLLRDAVGAESYEVERASDWTIHSRFSCAERATATVSVEEFLAAIPPSLPRSDDASFTISWWRPGDRAGLAMPVYTQSWSPADGGHYRSASMDASTGWWTGFSYLPGESLDPATA